MRQQMKQRVDQVWMQFVKVVRGCLLNTTTNILKANFYILQLFIHEYFYSIYFDCGTYGVITEETVASFVLAMADRRDKKNSFDFPPAFKPYLSLVCVYEFHFLLLLTLKDTKNLLLLVE